MKINDDVIKVIIEQAKKDAPIESCGLLLGKNDEVTERFTSIPSRYWKFKAGEIQAGQLKSNRVPMGISSSGGGGNTVRNMMVDDRSELTAEEEFDVYPYVEELTSRLIAEKDSFTMFFNDQPVRNFQDTKKSDQERFARYFRNMLDRGIYVSPSQFEGNFISLCHTDEILDYVLKSIEESIE